MFAGLHNAASTQIDTVKRLIRLGDSLRSIQPSAGEPGAAHTAVTDALAHAPPSTEWRVYEHCAAITRLYALYERFVEDLISAWLGRLPTLWPKYSDLAAGLRANHQVGLGKLLTQLHRRQYRHLNVGDVIRGLSDGLQGRSTYELLPEAFMQGGTNLHPDALLSLFASVGIGDLKRWLEQHDLAKAYMHELRGDSGTVSAELRAFVDFRNDAAHGTVDEVLGSDGLLQLADLVGTLLEILEQAVMAHAVECCTTLGAASPAGRIVQIVPRRQAVIARISRTQLTRGEVVLLHGDTFCKFLPVLSIQIDGEAHETISIVDPTEVGLRFDGPVRRGVDIFTNWPLS